MDLKSTIPKIELNIDEIVIDGGSHISEARLRQAVEQELVRQMGKNNLTRLTKAGESKVNIEELNLNIAPDSGEQDIGQQVAHHVQTTEPIKSFYGR
jgi:hypothetical protein